MNLSKEINPNSDRMYAYIFDYSNDMYTLNRLEM